MKQKGYALISAIFGASAIGLGAFGAHGLKQKLDAGLITANQLNAFDTGARYQMYHAIALLALIAIESKMNKKFFSYAFLCFVLGTLFFSGSLYLLSTKDLIGMPWLSFLGPITPIGGLILLIGWILIGIGIKKEK